MSDEEFTCEACGAPIELRIDTTVTPPYEWWRATNGTTAFTCQGIEGLDGHEPDIREQMK